MNTPRATGGCCSRHFRGGGGEILASRLLARDLRIRRYEMNAVSSLRRWKRAGLLSELRPAEAQRLLPRNANPQSPPSPGVLHAYYEANGDPIEGLWRRQADRYVEVHEAQHPADVCLALEQAMPSLGRIRVRLTASALFVHVGAEVATVSRVVRHARLRTRQVRTGVTRPRDIVCAINAILAAREVRYRFIELKATADQRIFVAIDPRQAKTLLSWGVTRHRDVGALWSFASWDRRLPARAAS